MTTKQPPTPLPPVEYEEGTLVERPDGFYWQDTETEKMYGPFTTLNEALADMQYQAESDFEEGESLQEAEAEIGIADWIDPDTGTPAEGPTPHLADDT